MGRKWLLVPVVGVALTAAALVFLQRLPARAVRSGPDENASRPAQLPIGQVVLYSSGVGYFQREGQVEGEARIDLSFPVSDINDLLKSLVLRDLDGGQVALVSYDSASPLERTLRSFALDLTSNPALADLLNQARGEKVELTLAQGAAGQPSSLAGTIIGVEKQKIPQGKDASVEVALLNLWCADGVRSLKLSEVQRLRFLSPLLEGELKKALEALAQGHDAQKKAVSLRFQGEGKRQVRVGYVIENPVWKTSYRLVLDKKEGKPFLQGWALVDNPSDEDWREVRMALVAGRPISFRMDLYSPLYVPRPLVEPELFASLRPPTYSGDLGRPEGKAEPAMRTHGMAGGKQEQNWGRLSEKASVQRGVTFGLQLADNAETPLNLQNSGVTAAATAAKLGESFQYVLDHPVTLPRQKSALLPILSKEVEGQRVSIYNEGVQAQFPLLGLKFKNTSGAHLMQGPVTLFEGSTYAGDARIQDLQPNEERLLSYAIDLGTEVQAKPEEGSGKLVHVKAVKGLLTTSTRIRESKSYTAKNRSEKERLLLIEHPVRNEFTLVDTAKPSQTVRDVYRFELTVPAGQSKSLTVSEERLLGQTIGLSNSPDEQMRQFIQSPVVSDKVKAGLKQALELRLALTLTQRDLQEQERQLRGITEDQTRLRANLREMPSTAVAYKRYLQKFDDQETQIEKLQEDIKRLQHTEHNQKKEIDDFLANFSAE